MLFLVFSIFLSCHKQMYFDDVRKVLAGPDCLESLKHYMKSSGCDNLVYMELDEYDMMFRCQKSDKDRGEFWDNYVFRISPRNIQYPNPKDLALIQKHTICVDGAIRVEAYPPTGIEK